MARFKRILLKLSGESLMGKQGYGIDPERLSDYANQIKEIAGMGVQIGIVIGGGNIFGANRRVLHKMEGHRGYGGWIRVHLLGWYWFALLHYRHRFKLAWYRD